MSSSISDMKRAFYLGMLGLPNTDTHDIDYLEQQFFSQYPNGIGLKSTIVTASGGQTVNQGATIAWSTTVIDTLGLGTGSAGIFTIPSSLNGRLLFLSAAVDLGAMPGSTISSLIIKKNSQGIIEDVRTSSSAVHVGISVSKPTVVNTGDTLSVVSFSNVATAINDTNFAPSFSVIQLA